MVKGEWMTPVNITEEIVIIEARGGLVAVKEQARQLEELLSDGGFTCGPCTEDGGETWDIYVRRDF